VFYRYFSDKEQLLAALAEDFLRDVVELPKLAGDSDFFDSAVAVYWNMFKPNIGIMVAVEQLAATQPRFTLLQNRFRRYGMDIVSASVRQAQQKGFAGDLDVEHTALAIALLFERFTGICLAHGISDEAAVRTLATIWRKTLYGDSKEI
jgi:AcrR family transcriptional regulator